MPGRTIVLAGAAAVLAAFLSPRDAAAQSNSDPDARWGAHLAAVGGFDTAGSSLTGGFHWRPRLTGAIGLELSAAYERVAWESADRRVEADHVPIEGSLLFFFLYTRRVQPYLLAGLGYDWVNPHGAGFADGTAYVAQNLFGLHGGAGVDVRVGARTSVWLDGRWKFLDVDAVRDLGLKSDTLRVSAGINLSF